jgi:replicative DNA helicase
MVGEHLPPCDPEAEQAALGSCLFDGDLARTLPLQAGDFYQEKHGTIWSAMQALAARGESVDLLTLRAELERAGTLAAVGGPAYLATLSGSVYHTGHAEHYAAIVRRTATRRRLLTAANAIAGLAQDADDVEQAVAEAQRLLQAVESGSRSAKVLDANARLAAVFDWLSELREGRGAGIPYGLRDLDQITGGAHPGQFVIIGGRPGMGKSSLLQTVSENMVAAGRRVLYATVEMNNQDVTARSLAWAARMGLHRIVTGRFAEHEYQTLISTLGDVAEHLPHLYYDARMTTASIRAEAIRMQSREGLDAVFVDYIQILKDEGRKSDNSVQRVTGISSALMALAGELNVPVIAASQLRRMNEAQAKNKPDLDDLRESGALEQDAHVVLLLHREIPTGAERLQGAPSLANLEVAKQRQGDAGVNIQLRFLPQMTRYVDKDWREDR